MPTNPLSHMLLLTVLLLLGGCINPASNSPSSDTESPSLTQNPQDDSIQNDSVTSETPDTGGTGGLSDTPGASEPVPDNPMDEVEVDTGQGMNEGPTSTEKDLTADELTTLVKNSVRTRANAVVATVEPGSPDNPGNVRRVERHVNATDWDYLFPRRAPEYSYNRFLKAVAKFPAFCGSYPDERDAERICRRALATLFAHIVQETGGHTSSWAEPEWRQGLVYLREIGWEEGMRGGYNGECGSDTWQSRAWPCGTFKNGDFKSYFGPGPKPLSYNYNYGPFSRAMYGDPTVLLNNPERVADSWLNIASAIFFFVYPQPPKPSMLHVVDGTWKPNDHDLGNNLVRGFGVTTQIINGGIECGGTRESQQSQNRIRYFESFANFLGLSLTNDFTLNKQCAQMQPFDDKGSGAL